MAADCLHGAGLHRRHRFTTGERHCRRLRLHGCPQLFGGQLTECAALPLAVVALGDTVFDRRQGYTGLVVEDELGRLAAALQWAGDNSDEGYRCQPQSCGVGLGRSDIVESNPVGSSREQSGSVCSGASVPHKNDSGHLYRLDILTSWECPAHLPGGT